MYNIYQVRAGETLESIANQFNTTVPMLRKINGYDNNYEIRPGQYIIVPIERPKLFEIYKVKKGDNMYMIAQNYNTNLNDLLKLNGLDENDYVYPDQEILVPLPGVNFYITQNGDTLNTVAEAMMTNPGALLLQNENIYLMPDQLIVYRKS